MSTALTSTFGNPVTAKQAGTGSKATLVLAENNKDDESDDRGCQGSSSPSCLAGGSKGAAAEKFREALRRSVCSRYLYANLLYVVYCVGIFFVNYGGYQHKFVDKLYVLWGVIHLVDALLYAWAWKDRQLHDPVLFPEYLNILGAGLYLWSATLYPYENPATYSDSITYKVHGIETSACFIELLATCGWTWSWWATFQRVPGRGMTLDDPDVWALLTLYIGACIYFIYNIQNLSDPSSYATNGLYKYGDIFYFLNSMLYLVSGLRDDGWFWFMPIAGMFPDPEEERLISKAFLKAKKKAYGTNEEALMGINIRINDDTATSAAVAF